MKRRHLLVLPLLLAGCGDSPKPLNRDAFYQPAPARQNSAGPRPSVGPIDESGAINTSADPHTPPSSVTEAPPPMPTTISSVVADAVEEPAITTIRQPLPPEEPATRPTIITGSETGLPATFPALSEKVAQPTPLPTGQYMVIDAKVAEVDGTWIRASQVLALIEKPLALRAKELDERAFRLYVADEINKVMITLVREELEYHAAMRGIDERDRELVKLLTTKWRQEEIANAGGSLEVTKRKYRADGIEFEKAVEDRGRKYMTQVYNERKLFPLIVVTPTAMRDYYDRNKDKQFTSKSEAVFRYIRIDISNVGDAERAKARAEEARQKVLAGEDFAKVSSDYNTDKNLRKSGGLPMEGPIQRGAFASAMKPVEDAAWALEPQKISEVVQAGESFYVVKLDNKVVGRVRPFEDARVQDEIREKLQSDQFRALREKEQQKLEKQGTIRTDPRYVNLALDMAMQRYPQWRAAK